MQQTRLLIGAAFLALGIGCVGEITDQQALGGVDGSIDFPDSAIVPAADAGPGVDAEPELPDAAPEGVTWKAVLMTGDDSISAFDNARATIKGLFESDGVLDEHTIQLSRDPSEQVNGIRDTSVVNFQTAMLDLDVGATDGCAVFMTSHGNQTGFYIRGRDYLTPSKLGQILDEACGDRPTVALISACFSGVFVDPVAKPNRIILTAARDDRTSFGCSPEATYTYWDGCVIDHFPSSETWAELYDNVSACIESKESSGGFTPSYPQGFFGADVATMKVFYR